MIIDDTIAHISDRRRHLKCAVVAVIGSTLLVAAHLLGYIWLNGKAEARPDSFVPSAWITIATLRSMALVSGILLGGSIGWLVNEVRRCTMREVVVHLVDRVNKMESQIQELTRYRSEQSHPEATSEPARGAAPEEPDA